VARITPLSVLRSIPGKSRNPETITIRPSSPPMREPDRIDEIATTNANGTAMTIALPTTSPASRLRFATKYPVAPAKLDTPPTAVVTTTAEA